MSTELMSRVLVGAIVVFATLVAPSPCATEKKTKVALWANPRLFGHPGKYKVLEHPCGGVVDVQTSVMPKNVKGADLTPEQVHEVSASGNIIRTWNTPVDTEPAAISGDRLLVQSHYRAYWVSTNRQIESTKHITSLAQYDLPKTCHADKALPGSGYAGCAKLKDKVSGKFRVLAFEGVCS